MTAGFELLRNQGCISERATWSMLLALGKVYAASGSSAAIEFSAAVIACSRCAGP